ncbi:MAG: TRAP transporter substrate-binding protein [Catalinimonas sp.]
MSTPDRRSFLQRSALAAGSALLAGCGDERPARPVARSDRTYRWRMLTTWPPNFPILGEGCALLADWVREMSGGRLDIQVFGGGELVPALEVFDAVANGVAEIGHGASYYWAGKLPAAQFFSTVPFGMHARQVDAWLNEGGGMALWEELYAPYNLLPFYGGNSGMQMGGWFNREISTIDDVRGLKMRIPGLGGRVFTAAGGTAVLSAGGEIYTNLERGVIDATEWIGPYHDYRMGFHRVAKYYYYPGWHEPGTAFEMIVDRREFEALPADLRGIFRRAAAAVRAWSTAAFEVRNAEYLDKLVREEGVQLRRFPDAVLARFRELTREVLAELAAKDADSRRVWDAYRAFQQRMDTWAQVTDRAYFDQIRPA